MQDVLIKKELLLSRLIINTKFGSVPHLNDYFVELFGFNFFNIKFCDLKNNLETFEKFKESKYFKHEKRLINQYFQLNTILLSFLDHQDFTETLGIADEKSLYLISNNGKSKVTFAEFLKCEETLNPDFTLIPFEYVSSESSNKRVERSVHKINSFLNLANGNNRNSYIYPFFMYHSEKYNINYLKSLKAIGGYMFFVENYDKISFEMINKYKNIIDSLTDEFDKKKILCGKGHPLDILIGKLIGCSNFEVSYPFEISYKGICIMSEFEFPLENINTEELKNRVTKVDFNQVDLKFIDLSKIEFLEDTKLIKENCKCFTCSQGYTRAYIYHLIICNEINATILIILHNLYFINELTKKIQGNFDETLNYFYNFLINQTSSKKIS